MVRSSSGQATLEYVLMLVLALSTVVIMSNVISGSRNRIWATMTCEIMAPCPNCPIEGPRAQSIRAAATQLGGTCR